MRNALGWLSLGLFTLLGLFFIAFGVLYASTDKMLGFHAAAVPEDLRAQFTPLYLALMKLIGSASVGLGALCLFVTYGPMRKQTPLAMTALGIAIAIPLVMAAYVAETLRAQTGAPTTWHLMGILLAILVTACATRMASR